MFVYNPECFATVWAISGCVCGLDSLSMGAIMELLLLLLLLFFDFCIGEAFLTENFIYFNCLLITALEYPFVLEEHYG